MGALYITVDESQLNPRNGNPSLKTTIHTWPAFRRALPFLPLE